MDPPAPPPPPPPPSEHALVVHWNDFFVASLIGLPDIDIHRLLEESQARMMGIPLPLPFPSPLAAAAPAAAATPSPPATPPPAKRPRHHPPHAIRRRICRYRHLQLRSGLTFHFSDDDGKEILTSPSQEPNLFLRKLLSKLPRTLRARLAFLAQFDHGGDPSQNDVVDADMEETDEWFVPTTPAEADPVAHLFHNIQEEFYAAYLREMRMRRLFRTLVQRWRIHRIHRKAALTSDPITLLPPIKPVVLYDMAQRMRYVYDASSMATWVESNLKHHQGGFASPQAPRNPWTNTPFTYPQLVSLYQQLQAHGELRWGLTTLRQHDFHIPRWHLFHTPALTLSAIRESLNRLDTTHARDMLTDFIFMQMDEHGLYMNHTIQCIYHEAVARFPSHWYLDAFKNVAYLHYEAEHFGQNRRRQIYHRCGRIFERQDAFLQEMREHGIGENDEEEDPSQYE